MFFGGSRVDLKKCLHQFPVTLNISNSFPHVCLHVVCFAVFLFDLIDFFLECIVSYVLSFIGLVDIGFERSGGRPKLGLNCLCEATSDF